MLSARLQFQRASAQWLRHDLCKTTSRNIARATSAIRPCPTGACGISPYAPRQQRPPQRRNYLRVGYEHDPRFRQSGKPERDPLRTTVIVVIAAGGIVYYVTHLERVPETGRWRFMDISPKYETKLAKAAYAELLHAFGGKILPQNHPVTAHVRRVVTDILDANNLGTLRSSEPIRVHLGGGAEMFWSEDQFSAQPMHDPHVPESVGKEWNLLVVKDPSIVNAMATFGNIVVFTGILPVCKDEQGLAAVLGHEIAHVVARHAPERYSYTKVLIAVVFLLQTAGLDFGLSDLLGRLLLELPNSRKQELEADTIGMRLISRACYDPKAAVEMHERLASLEHSLGGRSPEFLRTHPGAERRIKHLEELIPEANAIRAATPRCTGMRSLRDRFFGI